MSDNFICAKSNYGKRRLNKFWGRVIMSCDFNYFLQRFPHPAIFAQHLSFILTGLLICLVCLIKRLIDIHCHTLRLNWSSFLLFLGSWATISLGQKVQKSFIRVVRRDWTIQKSGLLCDRSEATCWISNIQVLESHKVYFLKAYTLTLL